MPTEEKHEIKMMYAVYADGRKEPVVINEIKDLSMEEAEPILEEYNFVKVTRCKDCKYYLRSNEKCELIDTRLHFYETDNTWTEDAFCAWGVDLE